MTFNSISLPVSLSLTLFQCVKRIYPLVEVGERNDEQGSGGDGEHHSRLGILRGRRQQEEPATAGGTFHSSLKNKD